MSSRLFAIHLEAHRLVAAEVGDAAGALLLDAGHQVFLGRVEELAKLARRLGRPLVTVSRATTALSRRNSPPSPDPDSRDPRRVAALAAPLARVA